MRSSLIKLALFVTLGACHNDTKVDVNLYSLITSDDHVLDYNLTLGDCYDLMLRSESDVACHLQPEGEIE